MYLNYLVQSKFLAKYMLRYSALSSEAPSEVVNVVIYLGKKSILKHIDIFELHSCIFTKWCS